MKEKKFAFVLLHYKNIKDTIECMESIKKLKRQKDAAIIVVDNHTLNKNEITKIKEYTDDIILLKDNVGFAKGNNAGCEYAINNYHPDFLCVMNNDIVIQQNNFLEEIEACYQKTKFDMMGPKIITDDGESVNPFPVYETKEEVEERIRYHEKLNRIYQSSILRELLKIYMKVKSIFKKHVPLENGKESKYDIALHGCAIIFSKKYYKKYKDIFYKETFLYHEEEFLNYRKNRDHLISYYDSKLEVFHKEGSSLNEKFQNNNYKKLIFRNKEVLNSLYLLKEIMDNDKQI